MVTIVTDKSYLQTNKINAIYMNEHFEEHVLSGKVRTSMLYVIHINFEPIQSASANNNGMISRNDGCMIVEIKIHGQKRATAIFRDMVRQIREQCPDQLYLDRIAEKFLTGDIEDDPSADQICFPREEKRRSKKVLRRAKRGRRPSRKRSRR